MTVDVPGGSELATGTPVPGAHRYSPARRWRALLLNSRLADGLNRPELSRPTAETVRILGNFGAVVAIVVDSAVLTVDALYRRRFPWREFFEQAWMMVSVSLLPTILITVPFGTVIVLEVGGLANQIGAPSLVGSIDALFAVSQVAPVVTALILSGAAGSAICSDLGARTIRDEIAALEVMGIDPVERLVAPRLLAGIVVACLLDGIVALAGVLSAYATAVFVLHANGQAFLTAFSQFARSADFFQATLKAGIFGFVATVLAAYKGLSAKHGAIGVGAAVNESVVITGVVLFFLNLVLTVIFSFIFPVKVL